MALLGFARKVWTVARQEGVHNFFFKLCSALGYRRLVFFDRPVGPLPPSQALPQGVSFELLHESQTGDYLHFRPEASEGAIRGRLQRRHLCFVARSQGHLVSATWVALEQAWIDYLHWELPLAAGEAYVYDAFTLQAWRRGGLSKCLSAEITRQLHQRGVVRSWRAIMPENVAALTMQARLGSRPRWMIKSLRLGPWRWWSRSPWSEGARVAKAFQQGKPSSG